ncbi:MAG TPA: hypothetical protein VFN38_16445 [Gemmatimonadaceae bacterium]|nr:hypothetical protein [Gemmatimonadaceae bacterium]
MRRYVVRVRSGPKVERLRFESLEAALAAIGSRGRELQSDAPARVVDVKVRRFEPVQQVVGRLELSGPGRLRGGVDVRGDGSAEAYTGRMRRRLVLQEAGEDAYAALARAITASR